MIVTTENVVQRLTVDNLVQISYLYSYNSRKYWRLCKEITVRLSTGEVISMPEGFYTDLSSVPKWLWSFERPFGDFLFAALVHDYLYASKHWPDQKKADQEMLYWSKTINSSRRANRIDNYLRYYAVRLFGWTVWNSKSTIQREIKLK
jgi:hypothetical protein